MNTCTCTESKSAEKCTFTL